jgi:hypothetical protein
LPDSVAQAATVLLARVDANEQGIGAATRALISEAWMTTARSVSNGESKTSALKAIAELEASLGLAPVSEVEPVAEHSPRQSQTPTTTLSPRSLPSPLLLLSGASREPGRTGPGPDPMKGQPAFPDGLDWGPAELIQDDPKPDRVRRAAQRVGRVLTWPNRALDAALRKWPTRTVAALAAVGVAIMVVYAFGVGEDAGRNRGIALGRQQAAAAASAAASKASPEVKLPRLRSNDGVCGSR